MDLDILMDTEAWFVHIWYDSMGEPKIKIESVEVEKRTERQVHLKVPHNGRRIWYLDRYDLFFTREDALRAKLAEMEVNLSNLKSRVALSEKMIAALKTSIG